MESTKRYYWARLDSNKTKQKINILIDDKLVIDSLVIANGFNNFFCVCWP